MTFSQKICWFQDNTVVFLKCPQFHLSHPHVNKCSLDTLIWKYINEQACTSCIHLPLMGCIWWRLLHQPVKGCSSLMEMYPEFRGRYCTMQRDFLNFVFCFLLYTLYIVWFQQYSRSSIFVDLVNLTVLSRCRFVDFNSDKIICCQRSYIDEFFILRIVSTTKSMTIGVQGTLMKEQYFVL